MFEEVVDGKFLGWSFFVGLGFELLISIVDLLVGECCVYVEVSLEVVVSDFVNLG